MTFTEMCAALVVEPYNLTPAEIAGLTDWQLQHLYFCKRPDQGGAGPAGGDVNVVTFDAEGNARGGYPRCTKEDHYHVWKAHGKSDGEIAEMWARDYEGGG